MESDWIESAVAAYAYVLQCWQGKHGPEKQIWANGVMERQEQRTIKALNTPNPMLQMLRKRGLVKASPERSE